MSLEDISFARPASDLPESDSEPLARQGQLGAAPNAREGRTYLHALAEERKARLVRLGEPPRYQAKLPPPPSPKKASKPIIPVNAALYYHEMWFWDLVAPPQGRLSEKPDFELPRLAPEMKQIIQMVCAHYDISKMELTSLRRDMKVAVPRQIIMYLARNMTGMTFPAIGRKLGRDHTSVIHGVRKIETEMETDLDLRQQVHSFQRALR